MPVAENCQSRLIAERYALEHPIGRGGMGVVWQARDRLLDREVAIKEVTVPDTVPRAERDSLRARVMREARAAARLSHPSAITLFDVLDEPDRAFIVMELVRACTLAEIVAREGPLPPERVARIGLQVASALDAAHRAGIVHRDVKPANVMVDEDGDARLADFGIAQVQGDDRKLTSAGMIVGSPAYMAPEQASGKGSGPEADLWGLGGTMYYAVEGKPPFERDNSIATLAAVVKAAPRPPRRAGALAPVIMALLAKDPADRPSLRQLRMRLARIITTGWESTAAQPALPVRDRALALPMPERSEEVAAASGEAATPSGSADSADSISRPWGRPPKSSLSRSGEGRVGYPQPRRRSRRCGGCGCGCITVATASSTSAVAATTACPPRCGSSPTRRAAAPSTSSTSPSPARAASGATRCCSPPPATGGPPPRCWCVTSSTVSLCSGRVPR